MRSGWGSLRSSRARSYEPLRRSEKTHLETYPGRLRTNENLSLFTIRKSVRFIAPYKHTPGFDGKEVAITAKSKR